jgi:hypothetical protein
MIIKESMAGTSSFEENNFACCHTVVLPRI